VVEIDKLGKVGLSICYEGLFPEYARILLGRGAEIIINPSYFGMKSEKVSCDFHDNWLTCLKARAIENNCYFISCTNHLESELMGVVISPIGELLINEKGPGVFSTSIDNELVKQVRRNRHLKQPVNYDDISKIPNWVYEKIIKEKKISS
jgi:predicted amidohydrolase